MGELELFFQVLIPGGGVAILAVGIVMLVRSEQWYARGYRARGRVTGYISASDSGLPEPDWQGSGSQLHHALVTFRDASGNEAELPASAGWSHRRYAVGSELDVVYPPHDASRFRIDNAAERYTAPAIVISIGVIWLLLATMSSFVFADSKRYQPGGDKHQAGSAAQEPR